MEEYTEKEEEDMNLTCPYRLLMELEDHLKSITFPADGDKIFLREWELVILIEALKLYLGIEEV